MSEIRRSLVLRWQIDRLDERVLKWCAGGSGVHALWFRLNAGFAWELYLTGKLRPKKLPGYSAPIEIPDDFQQWYPASDSFGTLDIPEEILFPKPKRGRPPEYDRFTVSQFGCSERHARRLAAAKKGLERQRGNPSYLEQLILDKHHERKALLREVKAESRIDALALGITRLYWVAERSINSVQSRETAEGIIERTGGIVAALTLVGFGLGQDLQFVAKTLGCSEATVRRTLKERRRELRDAGTGLPQFISTGGDIRDLFEPYSGGQPNGFETTEEEGAGEMQTNYSQGAF